MKRTSIADSVVLLARKSIETAFDVREGEYRRVLLLQLNIFLIILAHLIVKPVVTALFLSNVGIDQLPLAFILVAVAAMVVSSMYARELRQRPLLSIIRSTIVITAVGLIALGIVLQTEPGGNWIYYTFYTTVAIVGVVATSQLWILAGLVFNTREAARLFGLIGAGAIAGGITGGYVTSILAPIIGSNNLIFVAAALFAVSIPVSSLIWKDCVAGLSTVQHKKRFSDFGDHPIALIWNSRHLKYLASIIGVGVLVAKLVDFQFNALASASMGSSDELAAFLGFWFSNFNVASLLIQLFLTRRIVGMYGVGTSLFILPLALILGASLFLFLPVLSIGVFIKAADVTLKQSLNKSATELLALPLPVKIKNQTKSFIDIFVDSAATGLGGLMLIFMISGLNLPIRWVSGLIILLAVCWMYFANGVRKEYLNSFRQKLASLSESPKKNRLPEDPSSVLDGLRRVLQRGGEAQQLYILRKARQQPNPNLFEDIRALLSSERATVRSAALETLYVYSTPSVPQDVERMLDDPSPEVRVHAVTYLIGHSGPMKISALDRFLKHDSDAINGAALVGVATEARNNPEMQRLFSIEKRLSEKIQFLEIIEDPDTRTRYEIQILQAIGRGNVFNHFGFLEGRLEQASPPILQEAILAAGQTLNGRFAARICSFLPDKELREHAVTALSEWEDGLYAIMTGMLEEGTFDPEELRWIPIVCERVPSQSAVDFLCRLVESREIVVQLEALRALNSIMISHPELVVSKKDIIRMIIQESALYLETIATMYSETVRLNEQHPSASPAIRDARRSLVELLERRLDVILERIFRLLGLKYPPEEVLNIYAALRSQSEDHRVNSVEYLESLLSGSLKQVLIPIVESALLETLSEETIGSLKIDIPDQRECFEKLLESRDVKIKQAVLHLIAAQRDPGYLPMVQPYLKHANPKISDFAARAVAAISGESPEGSK